VDDQFGAHTHFVSASFHKIVGHGGRFTSPRHAQRFLSAFSGISPHFRPGRHRLGVKEYRREMADRFTTWIEVTGTATAA
jgi:hypothetical protein